MDAVTPETCSVVLQWINICILLHLLDFYIRIELRCTNHELKKTLHVSDSSSVHLQEFSTVHTAIHTGLQTACSQALSKPVWHIPFWYGIYIYQCYGGIWRHNTDNVRADTHSWTRLVILAKLWLWLPDDGSCVNRNMLFNWPLDTTLINSKYLLHIANMQPYHHRINHTPMYSNGLF